VFFTTAFFLCKKSGLDSLIPDFRGSFRLAYFCGKIFKKGIDFIEKWRYNVKLYEIVALGGVT